MTGGAQGQTGMWIAGSQSASKAPQVLMESLVFSSTFSSSQPILLFFLFAIWCSRCTKIFTGWVQTRGPRTQCSVPQLLDRARR